MKIAIDTQPLETSYRIQGTGVYINQLLTHLRAYYSEHEYVSFSQKEGLPKNVDLVHYPYFNPIFLTLPIKKPFPTVVTVHDLIPLVFPQHFPAGIKGQLKWEIQKWSLRGSSQIIADSNASKKDIAKYTGIPDTKIHVVYLAAAEEFKSIDDTLLLDRIRVNYNLPEKFVLYVGDVLWSKNIANLLKAIKEINLTLVMVGRQTKLTNFDKNNLWNRDLVILNKEAKDDKRIIRLGFVPDEELVAMYNSATLLVQPSFYEGFGLPILEAMACGCPVVTTRGGSLPEVAGEAAFYVDPNDFNDIANGIGEVYFNRKLQQSFSLKGLAQAKKFSWRKTAGETVKVYEKVVGS